jgi:flavorubredoxin
MGPVQLVDDVWWVGAIDWDIRDFHGYSTERGSTYNSYLIRDDKVTLFDTVKKGFWDDMLQNVSRLVEPNKIDYLVVNHVEMDHSGSLPQAIELIKPEKVFCSKMAAKALDEHFHPQGWPLQVVGTGDSISLGQRTVTFLETRMVHWPDSMFSYVAEDKLLISSDGFGQHWATSERFDDQVEPGRLMRQAAKYYANILLLYSPLIQKILRNVAEMKLAIDLIAPDHGLIWRQGPGAILKAYDSWSRQETKPKAVIVYDTMWHSTEMMAKAVADGIAQQGVSVKLMNLKFNHRSEVMTEILDAKALVFGSPTLNNQILPTVADILTYAQGLKPTGRIGAAFGSYGWSGESVKHIEAHMEEMKIDLVAPGVRVKFVPDNEALEPCRELGRTIGLKVKESAG